MAATSFAPRSATPARRARVVHNGVTAAEFAPVAPDPQATDLVFVGELRALKGVDVLIEAIALLARKAADAVTATIVGDGPDRAAFEAQAAALGLAAQVRFVGAKPARAAFALGRLLVVPSRAESLPYIVLEAAAAGLAAHCHPGRRNSRKSSGPMRPISSRPAIPRRWPTPSARPCRTRPRCARPTLRLQARVRAGFSADAMTAGGACRLRGRVRPARWLRNRRIFRYRPKHFLKLFR